MRVMTRRRKLTFAVGAAAVALLVAGLAAAGAAASWVLSPTEDSQAIIDDAALQLGVEPSELSEALEQALENRIDEAVDDGRLTEEQADGLRERLGSGGFPLLGGLGLLGRGFGLHVGPGLERGHFELLETAASYLDLTEAELREALEDRTLAEIAEDQGKTAAGLVEQLVATQAKRIDEAVENGKLTQEQATALKDDLDERMQALVNGELHRHADGLPHRFWPGSGSPRGPPHLGGPPA
jgi:polyhydroxyalkanoate synthesis regulator phasin